MEQTIQDRLTALLAYVKESGRVCPMPQPWNTLWQMLPEKVQQGYSWTPRQPLILNAWATSWASEKESRLREHILYAAEHNTLPQVDDYIRALTREEWAYGDGVQTFPEYQHLKPAGDRKEGIHGPHA